VRDLIDDYISRFPEQTQIALQDVRQRIHSAVPGAGEAIRYDIPTVTVEGRSLVHFAGWTKHLSLYPVPDGDADFERDIGPFRSGSSTAKFPYRTAIPDGLIERLVTLLLQQREPRSS